MWMSGYGVSALMSLGDDVSPESYQLGLADKIRANMNAYSYENTMVYVPDKKLIYHVYVDKPQDSDKTDYTIYNDIGSVYNYRTVAIKKDAFRNNKKLRTINFAESYATAADAYVPMEITIPDSAFAGCTGLERFELVYGTCNCFRVFLSSPRKREDMMLSRMAEYRGVTMEDLEARRICGDQCRQLFGVKDTRKLDSSQRVTLAQQLRRQFKLTFRQISMLVRLPESEVRAFIH